MKSFKVTEFNAPLTEVDIATPKPEGTQVRSEERRVGKECRL